MGNEIMILSYVRTVVTPVWIEMLKCFQWPMASFVVSANRTKKKQKKKYETVVELIST